MSLFGTINQSAGALQAAQIGLQVVGNNIANANTDGYIRQQLQQTPAVASRVGNLILGQGVRPTGVTQVIDQALAERMMNAQTAAAGGAELSRAYRQLEQLTGDLDGGGLSAQLTAFNNSLHELSTQPNDAAAREFVVLQGQTLADSLRNATAAAADLTAATDNQIDDIAGQINRLTDRIAKANVEIATIEGGGLIGSDATGLRDQRYRDLEELASYVNINFQEQATGNFAVFVGGDYLISGGTRREVYAAHDPTGDRGSEVRILQTDAPLDAKGGRLGAIDAIRGGVFSDYIASLDEVAAGLIAGFNALHTSGQGRRGHDAVLSTATSEPGVPLADAGLPFDVQNGFFRIDIVDNAGGLVSENRIQVANLGRVGDDTVGSIVAQIDSVDGVTATVTADGRISILSDSPDSRFTFAGDTSGFLAAAGINTFFTGTSAGDIAVNESLIEDADLLAISTGGIAADTDTLSGLVDLIDRPLGNLSGRSIRGLHEQTISKIAREISTQSSAAEGLEDVYQTLRSQHLAITGVNIDEESIRMIGYQRAFQASSRVISTAAEMLDILVNL